MKAICILTTLLLSPSAFSAELGNIPPPAGDNKLAPDYKVQETFRADSNRTSWNKHKNVESDAPTLEFTAAEPKTLAVELFFDTYEEKSTGGILRGHRLVDIVADATNDSPLSDSAREAEKSDQPVCKDFKVSYGPNGNLRSSTLYQQLCLVSYKLIRSEKTGRLQERVRLAKRAR